MAYPTPGDYQDALQFPEEAFTDPVLAAGVVDAGPLGLPQPITGAFAAVFGVDTPSGRVAVRCFLTDVPSHQRRYKAVANALSEAALPYTVGFEYQPSGVRVNGAKYPLVAMDWADGETLGRWVERHHADPGRMHALAEVWRQMLADLAAHDLAHGDLQHGNVLVREAPDGLRLTLVDYDAFVVPSLSGSPAPEVGHRNYQHPDRTDRDAGAHLDRFPGLVVYTALHALAAEPRLWHRYATGENLLFVSDDFFAPDGSPLFADLRDLDATRDLADALRTACYLPLDRIPPLDAVLAGGMPDAEARPRTRKGEMRRMKRSPFEQAFLPVALVAILAVLGLNVAGFTALALGGGLGVVVAMTVGVHVAYRRHSVVRRHRRLKREAAVLGRWADELETEARHLGAQREQIQDGTEEVRATRLATLREEALGHHLRRHFVDELDRVPAVGHRVVVRLKASGIRDAMMATPERVESVREIGPTNRAAILDWRTALMERYGASAPEVLSPAEEQRLQRHLERQVAALDRERARLTAKAALQRQERAHLLLQQDQLPVLGPMRYVGYLLRAVPPPQAHVPRTAPQIPRQNDEDATTAGRTVGPWWGDA